ncbi:MAG: DUF2752 domain-containing protein [Proteobacteria bacterium]|nr:DUF2752 domain-containing protein [Pseudomonadota bacterium]MBU1389990.1 DUF2752 domain-containing protein [Pseudomonadota bacterium]MBU1545059.1 DUF2752 domain-containing protein [Pseudomonadota bacterium]MBU2480438.1 DUF2752 domain-containing protein [Pseudomonadota bacterium]
MNEYLKAVFISWMIISLFFGIIVFVSFFPRTYATTCHPLVSKGNFHTQEAPACFFCGMTQAFFEISDFNFKIAIQSNRFSIALYLFFLFNFIVLCFIGIKKLLSI